MNTDKPDQTPDYHREVQEATNIQEMHAPIMREQAEPRDGFEPIPPIFAPLFGGLIFWAGFFFATNYRDFNPNVLSQDPPPLLAEGPQKELTLAEKGAKVFAGTCASCHGGDGAGTPNCPPLAGSEWVQERSPGVLVRILLNGVDGPIVVKGVGKNASMKLADPLSDADAAAVATFVRQAWGNKPAQAGDVTPKYIQAARKNLGGRTKQWTAAELQTLPDDYLDAPLGADTPPDKK